MTTNMTAGDRAVRLWVGLMVLATPILELHTSPYHLLGLIPLATAITGVCPLYLLGGAVRARLASRTLGHSEYPAGA